MLISGRIFSLVTLLLITAAVLFMMRRAKQGKVPHIRRVTGLDAIEEAVGRATEMGRPVHYTIGWADGGLSGSMAAQILAGLSVLGHVGELAAKYKVKVITTVSQPDTLPLHEEILRMAYQKQGKPEALAPDSVRFISIDLYAYSAGVLGEIEREKPAANIMIGAFWMESLLFTEAGFRQGAIQIGGTARTSQIPFFVATCDYTLIGEEIFAAGAYLSKEPSQIATIAAQDIGKIIALALLISGLLLHAFGNPITALIKL
jgi:hypothetical protein